MPRVSSRVAYSATPNMRRETVLFLSSLPHPERRRLGTRKGRRSLGCFTQPVPTPDLPRKNCWTISEWAGDTTPGRHAAPAGQGQAGCRAGPRRRPRSRGGAPARRPSVLVVNETSDVKKDTGRPREEMLMSSLKDLLKHTVADGTLPGAVALVAHGDHLEVETAGTLDTDGSAPGGTPLAHRLQVADTGQGGTAAELRRTLPLLCHQLQPRT